MRDVLYTSTAGRNEHAVKFWRNALDNVRVHHGRTDPGADEGGYPDNAKIVIEIVNEQQVRDKFDRSLFPDELPEDAVPIAVQDPDEHQQPNATLYVNTYRPRVINEYAVGTALGRALKIPYGSGGGVLNYRYQVYPRWAQDILNDWGSIKTRIDDGFLDTRFARWQLECGNFDAALTNVENARSELDGIGDDIEPFIDRIEDRDVQFAPEQLREAITVFDEDHPPILNHIEQQANNENAEYVTDDAPYMGGVHAKITDDLRPTISLETAMYQTWVGNEMPLGKFSKDITPEEEGYSDYGGCGDGPPMTTPPSTE